MDSQEGRRSFLEKAASALGLLLGAGLGGATSAFAKPVPTRRGLKPVTLKGFLKLPSTKPKGSGNCIVADVCVQAGDVAISCTVACDGCDGCDAACDECNGCNVCDHGCDAGCNTCDKCNGCDGCNLCDSICNTCNQCDMGTDVCVISCDGVCDGCNTNNTCTVDIDKDGRSDVRVSKSLENEIKALEDRLEGRRKALAKLRGGR